MSGPDEATSPLFCAGCTRELHPGAGDFYQVTIDAVADPSPPVVEGGESAAELRRQLEELLAELKDLSAREALDQVRRRLVLHLCVPCYVNWIENPVG